MTQETFNSPDGAIDPASHLDAALSLGATHGETALAGPLRTDGHDVLPNWLMGSFLDDAGTMLRRKVDPAGPDSWYIGGRIGVSPGAAAEMIIEFNAGDGFDELLASLDAVGAISAAAAMGRRSHAITSCSSAPGSRRCAGATSRPSSAPFLLVSVTHNPVFEPVRNFFPGGRNRPIS